MGTRSLNFPGSQGPMRDYGSLHIVRKRKATRGSILQNPNGQHEMRSIHSTELPFPDYISWYVKDKLAGKITCMVCGKEGHYTCDCPMKDQEEDVICILCNRAGHCHLWCCRHNVSENHACSRCGEKGHYTNEDLSNLGEKYTSLSCSSCDINHTRGKCPMGEVTCFLCEGKDHVPAQCHLSPVLTVITQYHRESFRSAMKQAMSEKSRRTVTPDKPPKEVDLYDDSRECQFKVNTEMTPKLSGLNHGEPANCDRENPIESKVEACENINTVAKEDGPTAVVSRVACINCNYEGHYANQCPKKPELGELEQYDVTYSNFHANRFRKKTPRVFELCDVTCFNCNDKGHYAHSCSKKKPPIELEPYDDNHGCQSKGGSEIVSDGLSFSHGVQHQCDQMSPMRSQIPASENTYSEATTDVAPARILPFTCFNCHDDGHHARMCPKQKAPKKKVRSDVICLNCNGNHYTIRCPLRKKHGELKLCDVTCFNCYDKGHFANKCPKKKQPG